jgi:hypothetical protein
MVIKQTRSESSSLSLSLSLSLGITPFGNQRAAKSMGAAR